MPRWTCSHRLEIIEKTWFPMFYNVFSGFAFWFSGKLRKTILLYICCLREVLVCVLDEVCGPKPKFIFAYLYQARVFFSHSTQIRCIFHTWLKPELLFCIWLNTSYCCVLDSNANYLFVLDSNCIFSYLTQTQVSLPVTFLNI